MEVYLETRDPQRDLGGLCECFSGEACGVHQLSRPHIHHHFELLYCMEGSYELLSDQHCYTLLPGCAVLVHPMTPHATRTLCQGRNRYLVLKFTPEALYSDAQPFWDRQYIFPYLHISDAPVHLYDAHIVSQSDLKHLLECILEEHTRQEYGYEMAVRAYILQVLLWFIRMWHKNRGITAMDAQQLPRLQSALHYIETHLDETLSAPEIAQSLSMGVSTFSRFFSSAMGMTLPAYIRQRRLGRAASMLLRSDDSITDVALACGFSSSSYLIACFREHYGVTPSRFRKLYANSPDGV